MARLHSQDPATALIEIFTSAPADSENKTGLFLVFAYENYHPEGGFNDFLGLALSLEQARQTVEDSSIILGEYQIVDHKTFEVVEQREINRTH